MLLLKPTRTQMLKAKIIFDMLGQVSGLKINLHKSELAVTSASLSYIQDLAEVVSCRSTNFPIRYLGLPLSDKRLVRADFYPLIESIQSKLTGWRASLLSVGGRLILTNSVLTAKPQYYMSVFLLPKWALRKIDQIRRRFLWHGHKDQMSQAKGLYMINWATATRPKQIGGLGIRDIQIVNHALIIKWMWQWHQQQTTWWKEATPMLTPSDKPWNDTTALPFWNSMAHLSPIFDSSVKYQIGNGHSIKFWHDNWTGKPLKLLYPRLYHMAIDKQITISQCKTDDGWSLQFTDLPPTIQTEKDQLLQEIQPYSLSSNSTQSQDQIAWLRSTDTFSVKSTYSFLAHTPSPKSPVASIWQIKAPLRVMIFSWLLLINRLPTLDNLSRRGWELPNMCSMCKRNEESVDHLFQQCPLATEIRNYIHAAFASQYSLPQKFRSINSNQLLVDSKAHKNARQWEITTCFVLWRERCRRVFSDKQCQVLSLVREIHTEIKTWFEIR